jgi:hypothetical protein
MMDEQDAALFTHRLAGWRRERSFYRPTAFDPAFDNLSAKPGTLSPIGQNERFALEAETTVVAPVSALLPSCRPATVAGFIASIIIDAVKRVPRARPWSHVGKESIEALAPSLTDADASSPIVLEAVGSGVFTPLDHGLVGYVFRSPCAADGLPMRSRATGARHGKRVLHGEAAARAGSAPPNLCPVSDLLTSAVADEEPAPDAPLVLMRRPDRGQSTKLLPRNVLEHWVAGGDRGVSHSLAPIGVVRGRYGGCTPAGLVVVAGE